MNGQLPIYYQLPKNCMNGKTLQLPIIYRKCLNP